MKFRIIAAIVLSLIIGGLYVTFGGLQDLDSSDGEFQSSGSSFSSPDENALKNLKID